MNPLPRHLTACAAAATALALAACVQVGEVRESHPAPAHSGPIAVRAEPCADRTDTSGHDLGGQATKAFAEKLGAATEFKLEQDARYHLTCEVSGFAEGSAIKRWILPGWGATIGRVTAMLTDSKTGEILVIAEGNATVSAGGLYTIGAEEYIVPTAVDDVVTRLRAWARGEAVGESPGDGAIRR